jgi:uncharacterized protein (DUF2235 family)
MSKNIIVCCDGTGQKFEENKANPLRFHYCLDNCGEQISFYDPGVGTFDPDGSDASGGWIDEVTSAISKTVSGLGLGYGIVRNIEDAYRYLMRTYATGDRVFLIGFSRGAFTAQAVGGLLNKCGLLDQHNDNIVPYALRIYLQKGNDKIASEFKRTMARECVPEMLGVWDTVKSLGNNHEDDFFYESEQPNSRHSYHALSIDERREDFVPSVWGDEQDENHIEVWFPGAHSDVGGGYAEDGLANGALQWMIARARQHNVAFREDRVAEFEPDPTDLLHDSRSGFWNLRDAVVREVPQGARVHQSALDRREAVKEYDPENLPSDVEPVTN